MYKFTVSTLLFALLSWVAITEAAWGCDSSIANHNTSWGSRQWEDRLVYTTNPVLKAKWLRKQSVDVVYPPAGMAPSGVLTMITVEDVKHDGTGGCAYLTGGGVGQTTASLHLKTQRSHGLNMTVKFWARNS